MRFVPIGQEEEKPQFRFVPLEQPTEEAPPLVSPEEMVTPAPEITPSEAGPSIGERLIGGAKYIAGTEPEKRGSLVGDVVAGVERANVGAAGVFRALAESAAPVLDPITGKILPENPLRRIAADFERLGAESEARAKARAPKEPQDVISAGVSSGVQSLTQNLLAIPMALLPGGQPAALTMLTTNTGGQAYQEAREKGLSPQQAIPYAVSQASIEYATEVMPLTKLVSDISQKTGFGKLLMNQIIREVPGEQIATVLQDMNDWAVLNPEKTAKQYLEERPSAAAQTLVATIVGVGGNVIVGKALQGVVGGPEAAPEVTPEPKEPVFVPIEGAPVAEAAPPTEPPAAPPPEPTVTPVTEEEAAPMFTEELVTQKEVREAKPEEPVTPVTPSKATATQEEITSLESDLAKVQAKQMDPMLTLDDPKLVEYQQQEAEIKAKLNAAKGVTPVTEESLYDRLIKASPAELKKIDIPTDQAPDLYLRASEDKNASPALVKKLTKIVNQMEPEEFKTEAPAEPVEETIKAGKLTPPPPVETIMENFGVGRAPAQKYLDSYTKFYDIYNRFHAGEDIAQEYTDALVAKNEAYSRISKLASNAKRRAEAKAPKVEAAPAATPVTEEPVEAPPRLGTPERVQYDQKFLDRGEFIPDDQPINWSDSKEPAKVGDSRRYLIDTPEGRVQVNLDFTKDGGGYGSAIYGMPTSDTGFRSLVTNVLNRDARVDPEIFKDPYKFAQNVVKQIYEEKKVRDAKEARRRGPKIKEVKLTKEEQAAINRERQAAQRAAAAKKEEHVEDGESEPITKPVIQEAVTKGAVKKDIDYTAMKREIERQVDEAIAKSPYKTEKDWEATYKSRQNFVTFDIPGDGKFKVKNNVERLEEFKKRLMAAAKPKVGRGPQFGIAPADVNTTLRDLVDSNEMEAALSFAELKGIKISESKLDLKQKLKVKEYIEDPDAFNKKAEEEAKLTEGQRQAMARAEEERRIATNKRLAEEEEKRDRDWVNARYEDLKTGSQRTIKEVLRVITKDGANKILDKIDISGEVFPEEIIEALQKKAGTYIDDRWKGFANKIESPAEAARVRKKLFEKYATKEGSVSLHELVEKEVDAGSNIITMESGERRLGDAEGYLSEKKIGRVGMDYAGFLIGQRGKGKKEVPLENIEPVSRKRIDEGIRDARNEQIDELSRMARKKSSLIKKVRNYGSDIETQRLLNELEDEIKVYRAAIRDDKDPVVSAESFLNHARNAVDGKGIFREPVLGEDVLDVIRAAYEETPWILEGLRLSIKKPERRGRASGAFYPMDRIVQLYRGSQGVEDPQTVRHELMHSIEQMMTKGAKDAVIQAWYKALQKAIKKYKDPASQKYFHKVMDFLENPSQETRDEATRVLPDYELYQYINPSEYWAVNAEKLYASQLGTPWERFKKAIRKLFEGLKSVFGFNNTYAVHKLFDQIIKGSPKRMSRDTITSYLMAGKADISFLENVQDDEDLIRKYNRPNTPMLDTEPVKNFVVNQAQFAKRFFKDAVANPTEALSTLFNSMAYGVHWVRNKNVFMGAGLEVADQEKYGGMLRNSQGLAIASIALDNALHGPNIATQVIFRGGIKFAKKAGVFVATKLENGMSMLGVYRAEAALKAKLGAQLGTDIIQGYLEAKRSRSILRELDARNKELEKLRDELDNTSPSDPKYDALREEVAEAVEDLVRVQKAADKVNMSEEEINDFISREEAHPELREIMDNFTAVNQNLLRFWRQVGLLSEGRYNTLAAIKDYVPWNRIMDDEEDVHSPVQSTTRSMTNIGKEKLFKSGKPKTVVDFVAEDGQTEFKIQPSSVVKVKVNGTPVSNYKANQKGEITFDQPLASGDVVVIETAREIENMIDNMTRNVMRMTMNGLRQYASTRIVQEYASRNEKGKIMVFPKADRNKGRFDYIANGRRVVVEIKDPLVAEAIFGMENIGLETFKAFAAVANMTRRMVTMNPFFQADQVFKDGPSAAFITGVKNPYGMVTDVYTSFIKALKGGDETVDILQAAGIGGFQSPTRTPEAEVKRKIGVINKSTYDIVMAALDQFGDSSDVAQRKAIYDRVMKETGDEMQAIWQASTVMPFHRHGSGRVAQAIIKTVPFMGAYANSIDVLARALIGGNIKGMGRKAAIMRLGTAFIALSAVSLLYTFVAGLDDDYWELDDQTRLRNIVLPFSKKMTGEMIMMPMNTGAAFIFKAIPELIVSYVMSQGTDRPMDKARAQKALGEAAVDALLGPEPIPSAVRPAIEIALDRNFFTERKLTPRGLENLEAADKFTAATSELGKMMGSVTDKLNPIEADHLIRSIFGTVGAMTQWGSNVIFAAARPEMTIKDMPAVGGFVAPKYPRGKEDIFYDFLDTTRKKYQTFNDRLDRLDVDSAVDYMNKNAGLIALYDYASQLESELSDINKEISRYGRATKEIGLTPKERREIIDGLQIMKRASLEGIEQYRKAAEEIKVTE